MKAIRRAQYLPFGILIVAFAGCSQQVTLAVPDMMCEDGCAKKVAEVLAEQPGVKRVNVDFPKRIATLSIDKSKFSADGAVAALVDHGFEHSTLKTDNSPVTPISAATTEAQPADTKESAQAVASGEANH